MTVLVDPGKIYCTSEVGKDMRQAGSKLYMILTRFQSGRKTTDAGALIVFIPQQSRVVGGGPC